MCTIAALIKDPAGQFTLDDVFANVFWAIQTLIDECAFSTLRMPSGAPMSPGLVTVVRQREQDFQDHLDRSIKAMCAASVGDPVLRKRVTSALFREMQSHVKCVEQCAVNYGATEKVMHMEKTLSHVLAIMSGHNLLRDECERLVAKMHRPGGEVHSQLHLPAFEGRTVVHLV
jgi:hypothetical protein